MAGTFDGIRQRALVTRAGAGLAARSDLAIFNNKATQEVKILVIDIIHFFRAELAEFWTGDKSSASRFKSRVFCH